jgi:four helix bundle protein
MKVRNEKNIILTRTFDFSLLILSLYKILLNKNEFTLSKQILGSGTSFSAKIEEVIAAYFKEVFSTKMIIVNKEARETKYWLRLLEKSQLVEHFYLNHFNSIDSICSKVTAIIKSSKKTILSYNCIFNL